MYHSVYKITNVVNNRYYIGVHSTKNLNDSYMGSSRVVNSAIFTYGIESFKKEILFLFDSPEEAYAKEAELVTEETLKDPLCYNLKVGGYGNAKGRLHPRYGIKESEETRLKKSLAKKGLKPNNYGTKRSEKANMKMAATNKGRVSYHKSCIINGVRYYSAAEAARHLDMKVHNVRTRLKSEKYPTWYIEENIDVDSK
ncbi:putative GIY-YIG family Seg-like homing endonuclease [Klebsiella phage AmPh_EK29]|uniref:Putative GIY-YIG family Seg-like homing endonuclease n=1 Tax=Klebsiella phage AmPh_EK29 TaxID=2653641 RepID=A0A5P8PJW8_9CAUD|nr:putative GIY-YIG family Seg-like homing endonuclease [Klebsiella phage AmPh_EK29]